MDALAQAKTELERLCDLKDAISSEVASLKASLGSLRDTAAVEKEASEKAVTACRLAVSEARSSELAALASLEAAQGELGTVQDALARGKAALDALNARKGGLEASVASLEASEKSSKGVLEAVNGSVADAKAELESTRGKTGELRKETDEYCASERALLGYERGEFEKEKSALLASVAEREAKCAASEQLVAKRTFWVNSANEKLQTRKLELEEYFKRPISDITIEPFNLQ